VTADVATDYLGYLRGSGLGNASVARALASLRGLHRFCHHELGYPADPTQDLGRPRIAERVPKALSEGEISLLLGAVIGDDPRARRDRAILEVLYAGGLRISELVGLSMADLNDGSGLLLVFGKGSKERLVPIGSFALEALSAWLGPGGRRALFAGVFARRHDEEAVFISTRGRRMSRQAAWFVVHGAAERVGLADRVTPHVLRHSCATHLLDHGADIRVVQEILGHASITTTQIYTKVSQERLRQVFESSHPRAGARTRGGGTAASAPGSAAHRAPTGR
jgi:integrase/recombinase XerD